MQNLNNNIPSIDDRPLTPKRLEAMYKKWLSQEEETVPMLEGNKLEVTAQFNDKKSIAV